MCTFASKQRGLTRRESVQSAQPWIQSLAVIYSLKIKPWRTRSQALIKDQRHRSQIQTHKTAVSRFGKIKISRSSSASGSQREMEAKVSAADEGVKKGRAFFWAPTLQWTYLSEPEAPARETRSSTRLPRPSALMSTCPTGQKRRRDSPRPFPPLFCIS